ncbi:MAG: N-acetylmuramoyl-L-alanine amidase [Clostridia bacterium]|jgi:N-acetylmuramoyl-L-alanine amidase|nr:N-acetylmuramoyl-L-alanine amidase CwlD [Clostridiales bacterium]MDK2985290.1 N-acetylmuramoyl-L-alanine amidase [Clostridia bacterium]
MGIRGFYAFRIRYRFLAAVLLFVVVCFTGYWHIANLIEKRTVEAMSWVVANKVIAIDPGHGGYDCGAIGPGGTKEKDITLAVSKKLANQLSQAGALVILTRDMDMDFLTPGPGTKKKRDLDNRLKIIRENNAEIYINIQANSFGTRWTGAQTFYNPKSEKNKLLAECIQEELKKVSNTDREIKPDSSTYMLKTIDIPAALVEVGFISNVFEEKKLNNPKYQEELAWGMYTGIIKFLLDH